MSEILISGVLFVAAFPAIWIVSAILNKYWRDVIPPEESRSRGRHA
jgi:hypothetical protein